MEHHLKNLSDDELEKAMHELKKDPIAWNGFLSHCYIIMKIYKEKNPLDMRILNIEIKNGNVKTYK